jgi:Domain of unknown function (DUF5076)
MSKTSVVLLKTGLATSASGCFTTNKIISFTFHNEDTKVMGSEKVLSIPPVAQRDKASFEVLRVWIAEQGQHVSIRSGAWDDPFAWGIVLADLARHIALAHEMQNEKIDKEAFLERLLEGFSAEIDSPTDEPEGEVTH